MGAWGTAISSNDTYADVYGEFFYHYDSGLDVAEISKKLIDEKQEIIQDENDSNNFWFALAKAQWECKQLDPELLSYVRQIVQSDSDLEIWRQLDATQKDLENRRNHLRKFLSSLEIERPKAKGRKKSIIRQPVFDKGDCLTFKLLNGNYGGAIVLEAIRDSQIGYNLIALTRINLPRQPNLSDFENAEVLILNYGIWKNEPAILWYDPVRYKKFKHLIDRTERLNVVSKYYPNEYKYGFVGDFDIWFIEVANSQFNSELTNALATTRLPIKELLRD